MKVFVVKNKEEKYWSGHEWVEDLALADFYFEKNDFLNNDEMWQEVTIVEGSLEEVQNQKAIECLKEVKVKEMSCDGKKVPEKYIACFNAFIDDKIKELKGEE